MSTRFDAILAKNKLTEFLAQNRKALTGVYFPVQAALFLLEDIEKFTGLENQPSVKDTFANTFDRSES